MKQAFIYETELGKILIAEDNNNITDLTLFDETNEKESETQYEFLETPLIHETAVQLMEYLEGKRMQFTVPLNPKGTRFQQQVWEALKGIPYGDTRSYKQIAESIGNPKACRAVGMANHNNPIMCIIPCHRVIGSDKSLVGYAGGLHIKQQLLELEKNIEGMQMNE
jgi:methylated-DNA-[protein]-cysteine S-methyltransferase